MSQQFTAKRMTRTTTADRRWTVLVAIMVALILGCRGPQPSRSEQQPETLSRTEFTDRIENFFEHEPLTPGKPSRFMIHLTDLSDGSPIEAASVTLRIQSADGGQLTATAARPGRVIGIYLAEVTVPAAGKYDIEFYVRNGRMDERMALSNFVAR